MTVHPSTLSVGYLSSISCMANYHAWKETSNEADKCCALIRSSIRWSSLIGTYLQNIVKGIMKSLQRVRLLDNKRSVLFDAAIVLLRLGEEKTRVDQTLCFVIRTLATRSIFPRERFSYLCGKSFASFFFFFYRILDEISCRQWRWS